MRSFICKKEEKLSKSCLSNIGGLSYNVLMRLIKDKEVKVNGKRVKEDILLHVGDNVFVYQKENDIEFYSVIYEDENIIVINKKKGFTSEQVFEELKKTYANAFFIHRLDRNTSGIMVFANSFISERELLKGFKNHAFIKEYKAEVFGKMDKKEDVLTAYLLKNSDLGIVKIFDKKTDGSVFIKTGYKVLEEREKTSVVSVRLYTGKTHQIRAHLAHIGHFVVGDGKYGNNDFNKQNNYKEQQLSAYKITFAFDSDSPLYYLNGKSFSI